MIGFVVVEPDLQLERVPDYLLDAEVIMWPAQMNTLAEVKSGKPTPLLNANALYHRSELKGNGQSILVWTRRDANALPSSVTAAIRAAASAGEGSL